MENGNRRWSPDEEEKREEEWVSGLVWRGCSRRTGSLLNKSVTKCNYHFIILKMMVFFLLQMTHAQ